MTPSTRALMFATVLSLGAAPLAAQSLCGTPVLYPSYADPAFNHVAVAYAYDPSADDLFVASNRIDSNSIGAPNYPEVHRLVGGAWVPILDSAALVHWTLRGMDFLDAGGGPELYIWGEWSSLATNVRRWNGSTFVAMPIVPSMPRDLVAFDDGTGSKLYAATLAGVYQFNGSFWVSIGTPNSGNPVEALVVHDAGTGPMLYAGGFFSTMNGVSTGRIARWSGGTWSGIGAILTGSNLRVMKLYSGSAGGVPLLYTSGSFATIAGQSANNVAMWNGSVWTGLGQGLPNVSATVSDVTIFDRGNDAGPSLVVSGHSTATSTFVKSLENGAWVDTFSLPAGTQPYSPPLLVTDLVATVGSDLIATARVISPLEPITPMRLEACGTGQLFCAGDGSEALCPCGNTGTAGHGCASSAYSGGAILRATGFAGASAGTDTLVLKATDIPGPGLFFQSNGLTSTPINFGDGHLCAAVGIMRLGVVFPTAGRASYPGGITPAPIHSAGLVNNGDTKHYQCWYRSQPGLCGPDNYNLTQGLTITWGP